MSPEERSVIEAAKSWRVSGDACDCKNNGAPWHAPTCPTEASYRVLIAAIDALNIAERPTLKPGDELRTTKIWSTEE